MQNAPDGWISDRTGKPVMGSARKEAARAKAPRQNAYTDFLKKLRSADDNPARRFIPLGHGSIFPIFLSLTT